MLGKTENFSQKDYTKRRWWVSYSNSIYRFRFRYFGVTKSSFEVLFQTKWSTILILLNNMEDEIILFFSFSILCLRFQYIFCDCFFFQFWKFNEINCKLEKKIDLFPGKKKYFRKIVFDRINTSALVFFKQSNVYFFLSIFASFLFIFCLLRNVLCVFYLSNTT